MSVLGITKSLKTWNMFRNTVEQVGDNWGYSAPNGDTIMVLAGPARLMMVDNIEATQGPGTLLSIGTTQSVTISQNKQVQPLSELGSRRLRWGHGRVMTTVNITRLVGSGRNLMRALYHNAVAAGFPVTSLEEPPAEEDRGAWFLNLDSELFTVPFGLGVVVTNMAKQTLGGFYIENCTITNWNIGINVGSVVVMENIVLMADRIYPAFLDYVMSANINMSPDETKQALDNVLGIIDTLKSDVENEDLANATIQRTS